MPDSNDDTPDVTDGHVPAPLDRLSLRHVVTVLFVLILVPFVAFAFPQIAGADHSYAVLSNSMQPTFSAGSVVLVEEVPTSKIQEGDIITFQRTVDGSQPNYVTHRVVKVVKKENGRYFRTKGDANEEADQYLVAPEDVIGEVMFSIPVLGYAVTVAQSDLGIVAFVIIPSILLIASEVCNLLFTARTDSEPSQTDTP